MVFYGGCEGGCLGGGEVYVTYNLYAFIDTVFFSPLSCGDAGKIMLDV